MTLIESTKDGRPLYRVRWNYRTDPSGRKVYDEKRFRDRKQAEAWNNARGPVTTAVTERLTVSSLLTRWQAHHADTWALRTRRDYDQQSRIRIMPFLGRDRVAALTPQRVNAWVDWMKSEGHQPKVSSKALVTLKTAIRWGRSRGLTTQMMVDDVRGPKLPKPKDAHPYTPAEVETIAKGAKHHRDAAMLTLAAYSGLRWSELRGLQWGDIDWKDERIDVARSVDGDRSYKLPKSGEPRPVAILAPGMKALRAWRKAAANVDEPTGLVFPNKHGLPMHADWYNDRLPKIREASGIHFDPHELRDTYASILIAAGIGELELTLWLGHSSVEVTMRHYGRLFAKRRTTIAKQANAILKTL